MRKFVKIFPKILMWVLFGLSLIVVGLFFLGGSHSEIINGEELNAPDYTNTLIVWCYILSAIAISVTIVVTLIRFVMNFKDDPKKGLKSLAIIVSLIVVILISWNLGSPEKVEIIGYEGTANEGVMAQFSDMCLYVMYILCAGTVLAMFGSALYSKLRD
ncbi:MAG: hypothetical protein IAC51_06450 [bacterium]|uniref:Uncharacterized protein n=1 Tax=Candidatus Aphodosoma intestinipullorum TaxID=2840674 RepID=A0A940DKP9_9BACT|nr:hypothetical protein [Candidatus Aphodosoma intestinipullorum]